MSNLPVLAYSQGASNLPAEIMQSMAAMFERDFAGLGGFVNRRIKVAPTGFELTNGQAKEIIPFDQLYGVFVGSSPTNYAVWYEKSYVPGQEPEQPDLVWHVPDMGNITNFPDALPAQFRKKVQKDGREVWAFQLRRRVAFCIMRSNGGTPYLDLDNPYIIDLSGMSLIGKGFPDQNIYKWSAIVDLCKSHSTATQMVYPTMFLIKIVVDANAPRGVVSFMPNMNQQNRLQLLDDNLVLLIHETAQKQSTRDMLVVREKLEYGTKTTGDAPVQPTPSVPQGQMVDPSLIQTVPPRQAAPVSPPPFAQPPVNTAMATQPPPFASPPSAPQGVPPNLLEQARAVLAQQAPQAPVHPPLTTMQSQAAMAQVNTAPMGQPSMTNATVQASIDALAAQLG